MYRVWFCDLEKAIKALQEKTGHEMFCYVQGNVHGDFVFKIDEFKSYVVDHHDFTVWELPQKWTDPWKELK
jgi:hypothetical protein